MDNCISLGHRLIEDDTRVCVMVAYGTNKRSKCKCMLCANQSSGYKFIVPTNVYPDEEVHDKHAFGKVSFNGSASVWTSMHCIKKMIRDGGDVKCQCYACIAKNNKQKDVDSENTKPVESDAGDIDEVLKSMSRISITEKFSPTTGRRTSRHIEARR